MSAVPQSINHLKEPVEGVLVEDLIVGHEMEDYFKVIQTVSETGVGRPVGFGTMVFHAETPVWLLSIVSFGPSEGKPVRQIGCYRLPGWPFTLMGRIEAFRAEAWSETLHRLENPHDSH